MSSGLLELFGTFGIEHSNRRPGDHWNKNCFNTSFPVALACYLMKKGIKAIYNKLEFHNGKPKVVSSEIDIGDVFYCGGSDTSDLYFRFDSVFEKYRTYSADPIDGIDLVVITTDGKYLAPLEVKLSVLQTDSSGRQSEPKSGSDLMIRSAVTSYCALGMYDSVKNESKNIRNIFEDVCTTICNWSNGDEVMYSIPRIAECINVFQERYHTAQKPLLMQAIWKINEKTSELEEDAFDIIVWSDYAISRLFIDKSYTAEKAMSRASRATSRLARCLWELSRSEKIRLFDIYSQMAYGNRSDKEFAIGAKEWTAYISTNRIIKPILKKNTLNEIIKPGYIEKLSPERRFDWSCFIEYERLFEKSIERSGLGKKEFCRKKCYKYLCCIENASKLSNMLGFGSEVITRFKNKQSGLKGGYIPHKKRVIALAIGMELSDYERFEFIRCSDYEYPSEKLDIQVESIIRSGIENFNIINEKLCEIDPDNDLSAPLKKEI